MFYYMHNNNNNYFYLLLSMSNVLEQGSDFWCWFDTTQFSCHCVHSIHAKMFSIQTLLQCILGYPNLDYPDPRLSGRQNGKIKLTLTGRHVLVMNFMCDVVHTPFPWKAIIGKYACVA